MAAQLPDAIDCRQLADEAGTVAGCIGGARLARVAGDFRAAGEARAELGFSRDGDGRVLIRGEIEAPLEARCQRCLEWMPLRLRSRIDAVVLPDAPAGGAGEDVVIAPAGRLALVELVEDEILLACPMIPAHDTPECHAADGGGAAPAEDRHRPFAGLGELMNKGG